jgi:hypothetical protein
MPITRPMTLLGINCSGSTAYFATVGDGIVLDDELERLTLAPSLPRHQGIRELVDALRAHLRRLSPQTIGLFAANYQPRSYAQAAGRASIEAYIDVAAAQENLPVDHLHLPTIKRIVGHGSQGSAEDVALTICPTATGRYWAAGRNVAALVAMALWSRDAAPSP